ncbi:MAG: response regulator [Pseudoxanthomonas sp.]
MLFILDMEKILASLDSTLNMSQVKVDTTPVEGAGQFHLLVAENSSSLRNVMQSSLEKSGFQVTAVGSGRAAWDFLLRTREEAQAKGKELTDEVHLVISDIEMPEMDGHMLTAKNPRKTPGLSTLPIILFSSLITDALYQKGVKMGADGRFPSLTCRGLNKIIREVIAEKLQQIAPVVARFAPGAQSYLPAPQERYPAALCIGATRETTAALRRQNRARCGQALPAAGAKPAFRAGLLRRFASGVGMVGDGYGAPCGYCVRGEVQ